MHELGPIHILVSCVFTVSLTRMSPSSYGSCDGPGLCGYDLHDDEGVAWGQEGKYSTTLFTQRARKILESHDPADRPLFLLLSLQVPKERLVSTSQFKALKTERKQILQSLKCVWTLRWFASSRGEFRDVGKTQKSL